MQERLHITLPITEESVIRQLKAGTRVVLDGTVYVGRDAAHKKMWEANQKGEDLPVDFKNQAIYYMGPTPVPPGMVSGSAGPTSSYRMDPYSPMLLEKGLKVMIGKGRRSEAVIQAMKDNQAVYLVTTGGAAALIAKAIVSQEVIAYKELGPEALRRLTVRNFPAIVAIDAEGNNLYETGQNNYRKETYEYA